MPERSQAAQLFCKLHAKLGTCDNGIDPLARDQILGGERAGRVCVECLRKAAHRASLKLDSGGGAVTTVVRKMPRACGQSREQIVSLDAPPRTASSLAFQRNQYDRTAVALG